MQRHICSLQLSRLCGSHHKLSTDHLAALVTALSLHYQHGYQTYGLNMLPTDQGPSDPYAILAAHILYDLAYLTSSSQPLITALVLLDNLLKNSPSNFNAKLLAVRIYHTLGKYFCSFSKILYFNVCSTFCGELWCTFTCFLHRKIRYINLNDCEDLITPENRY